LDINKAFEAFDTNEDGRINRGEFNMAFKKMGFKLSREELDELWNTINTD